MKLKKRRWKAGRIFYNKKGFTLVELIAVFGLTAIFVTAAIMVLTSYVRISSRINNLAHAQVVSDTLLNEISSQMISMTNLRSGPWLTVSGENLQSVTFFDRRDNQTTIQVNAEGILECKDSSNTILPFGKKTYMQNTIKELKFEPVSEQANDWSKGIKVTITLVRNSNSDITYTDSKIIRCYNHPA